MRNLNIKFNNCSYLQLLIDDIDIRLFDEFDDFLIVYSELYASAQNSGKFLIFTCACGVADDGGWDWRLNKLFTLKVDNKVLSFVSW